MGAIGTFAVKVAQRTEPTAAALRMRAQRRKAANFEDGRSSRAQHSRALKQRAIQGGVNLILTTIVRDRQK
jgi:hypothetical protein